MIPHTDGALRMLSQRLMKQLLPDLKSLYSLSDGALNGLLINAIADETGEGIQRRLDDIAEMDRHCCLAERKRLLVLSCLLID